MSNNQPYKQPVSVLIVIYDNNRQILLMERADKPGFWQSVTGSLEPGETIEQTAKRELAEETGIYSNDIFNWQQSSIYEIYPHWRHRYAPELLIIPSISFPCVLQQKHLFFCHHANI